MGKSKLQKGDDSGGVSSEWLNTYADMVTLLLTFFVLLFSMSSINPVKWDMLIQTYGNQQKSVSAIEEKETVPTESSAETDSEDVLKTPDDIQRFLKYIENPDEVDISDIQDQLSFENMYEIMNQYIISNNLTEHVGLDRDENFVMIRFRDQAYFTSGQATLKTEATAVIKSITAAINLVNDQVDQIKVTGYTDSVPQNGAWGIPDNLALSQERARQVSLFLKEYGIESSKIYTIGRAEEDPIASNDTPEGRALNRRVEIVVTRKELPQVTTEPAVAEEPTDEVLENEESTDTNAPEVSEEESVSD